MKRLGRRCLREPKAQASQNRVRVISRHLQDFIKNLGVTIDRGLKTVLEGVASSIPVKLRSTLKSARPHGLDALSRYLKKLLANRAVKEISGFFIWLAGFESLKAADRALATL